MVEYQEAANYIRERLSSIPKVAVLTGTGLGLSDDENRKGDSIRYRGIPNFPMTSVRGHKGELSIMSSGDNEYLLFSGRLHYYEGHNIQSCGFPIHVMHQLGITDVIMTNVSGSVNSEMKKGDFVLVKDHMNLMGVNPLRGIRDSSNQIRFPEVRTVHATHRHAELKEYASDLGVNMHEGVYVAFSGPSLESPAEYKMVRTLGADIIGMSTVPEVITAAYYGMSVNVLSLVSNESFAEVPEPASIESVLKVAEDNRSTIYSLINRLIQITNKERASI